MTAWNKGMKGYTLPNRYMKKYKPGMKHPRHVPVGSEREKKGYIRVKIANPGVWKYKHVLIWEAHNGPLPPGHIVLFCDKNNRNFEPANLMAVSRAQLCVMNTCGLIRGEATKCGKVIADIKIAIRRLSRE